MTSTPTGQVLAHDTTTSVTPTQTHHHSRYAIESFRQDDVTAFLELYETVFGHQRSQAWFRWKYVDNPYTDHVPIVVARNRADGTLIGCRSYLPLEVTVAGTRVTAFQPCDTMVHPDHRRQGLFTAMNRWGLERYRDDGPAFFFNFPNTLSKAGNERLGWQPVGQVPMYYRVQNPAATLGRWLDHRTDRAATDSRAVADRVESGLSRTLEAGLSTAAVSTHRVCDHFAADGSTIGLQVEQYARPPDDVIEELTDTASSGIHVCRTPQFYHWRLANPVHQYETLVAFRTDTGAPVGALLVSPVDEHLRIVDRLPRVATGEESALERGALERLLEQALERFRDRSFVTAFGQVLPRPLRYRFLPDTEPPMRAIIKPTARTLYARPSGEQSNPIHDVIDSSSLEDWRFSRLDLDTG